MIIYSKNINRSSMERIISEKAIKENVMQPTTLQEAINIIKFLNTTHKHEVAKLKEAYAKQADIIKKLESNRKKELEFLSCELQKYEVNLALRTESVAEQLAAKDLIIKKQAEQIEELTKQLKQRLSDFSVNIPEINIICDSNSDSGVALEADDGKTEETPEKPEIKTVRKYSRRFGDTISFFRRVDFSPIKYKPCNREGTKKKDEKNNKLQVPVPKRMFQRQTSNDKAPSEDEPPILDESFCFVDRIEPHIFRTNKQNDSMNNHFSDDGSDDTSEELFDRVMTRSSIRKSVKANPKYKKINRTKARLLEQVKVNIND